MFSTRWIYSDQIIFTISIVNLDLLRVFIIKDAATLPGTVGLFGRSIHAEAWHLSDVVESQLQIGTRASDLY